MEPTEWSVSFCAQEGRPGRELRLDADFRWADRDWYVPAVYLCDEGMVMDLCMRIPAAVEQAFLDQWAPLAEEMGEEDECLRARMFRENPMAFLMDADAWVNGEKLRRGGGSGGSWCCLEEWLESNSSRGEAWMTHYGLDRSCCWSFFRERFCWPGTPQTRLDSLSLELTREPADFPGEPFTAERSGQTVTLTDPSDGKAYRLEVLELEEESLAGYCEQEGWESPDQAVLLRYRLTPHLSRERFWLKDADQGELSRRISDAEQDALAIIGGADGPVAFCVAEKDPEKDGETAVSALRFQQNQPIRWRPVFRPEPEKPVRLTLI